MDGVYVISLLRYIGPFFNTISSPGKILTISLTKRLIKGSNIIVSITLNMVWAFAICLGILTEVRDAKYINLLINNENNNTPNVLKTN